MAVTPASFRVDFPEFADVTLYPDSGIQYYLDLADLLLVPHRWGQLYDKGTELFVAHNVAIERSNQNTANVGGVPGMTTGPISSKSVDKVSVSYDTNAGIIADAGHWNLTVYGTRFLQLVRMVGMGPLTIIGSGGSGGAWPGVIQ